MGRPAPVASPLVARGRRQRGGASRLEVAPWERNAAEGAGRTYADVRRDDRYHVLVRWPIRGPNAGEAIDEAVRNGRHLSAIRPANRDVRSDSSPNVANLNWPVTPKVAGSSPVAPVQSACMQAGRFEGRLLHPGDFVVCADEKPSDPGAGAHPRDASALRPARAGNGSSTRRGAGAPAPTWPRSTSDAEATDAPGSDARSGGAGSPPSTRAPAPRAGLEEDPPPTSYPGGGCPSASRSARGVAASFAADGGSWLRRSREVQPQRRRQCSSPRRIHRRDCSCRPR